MIHPIRTLAAAGCLLGLFASAAQAAEPHVELMERFAERTVRQWISEPILIAAIKAQNARYASLTQSQIDSLDIQWRTETALSRKPLITEVSGNELSKRLTTLKAEAKGVVTEVFVMDNRGLNVAISDITSDYWQGDEDKWQKTFLAGPGAMFIDPVELDSSTDSFQSAVSFAVTDPESGEVIGAITVGVDIDELKRRGT